MAADSILSRLDAEFDSPPESIRAIVELCDSGAPASFIAMFRRDETGDLHESRVQEVADRYRFLAELEQRKVAIANRIADIPDRLGIGEAELTDCFDREFLDDIDRAIRPHDRAFRERAAELGLTDLIERIRNHDLGEQTPLEAAAAHVDAERGLESAEQVLDVAVLALAERLGEDPIIRRHVREELSRGLLTSRATDQAAAGKHKDANRYAEFFDFQEPVRRIPAPRMLALRKAEREGIVHVRLELPAGRAVELFRARFSPDVDPHGPLGELLDRCYSHSYAMYVHGACDGIVRHDLKEHADRETVQQFGRALRSQLMGPGLGQVPAMAVRASGKAIWVATTKADGGLGPRHTLGITAETDHEAAAKVIAETIREVGPKMIAVPHGRGEPAARKHVRAALAMLEGAKPPIVAIDETASMVYATSATGRRKLPGTDTGMRATISLVRRLCDPLRELTRVDPQGLGLGQNLAEVHQGLLTRTLESVSSSCIAHVGVDLNRADTDFLALVPGLGRDRARAIVEHRNKHGRFDAVSQLRDVEGIGGLDYQWVAGWMRVFGGSEPLDATGIHPDDYPVATAVAAKQGVPVTELFGQRLQDVDVDALCAETGRPAWRVRDVLRELTNVGRDPRGELVAIDNQALGSFEDLRPDQQWRGRITNLTEFGAFVDLGIGCDGLVHVSQVPPARQRNPGQALRVGEIIDVWVVSTDPAQKRIGLSMLPPRHVADGRPATIGERMAPAKRGGRGRREEREVTPLTRAAREPDGRRGGRRNGPRPPRDERGPGEGGGRGEGGDDGFRRGRRDDRGGGGRNSAPRVITIDSERRHDEVVRGHKGELKSLAGLRSLLGSSNAPSSDPTPASEDRPE